MVVDTEISVFYYFKHKSGVYVVFRKSEVLVKVCGPHPENALFLVHEVFEALIAESFNGVHYDYCIPCVDCIKCVSHLLLLIGC